MAKIYYSYQHRDKDIILKISKELEERGHQSFIDETHIKVGQDWRKMLLKALKNSDGVIVLISEKSLQSNYVISEIGAARAYVSESLNKKFIIPLIVGDMQIPSFIEDLYCIRVNTEDITETIDKIDASINAFVGAREAVEDSEIQKREFIESKAADYISEATATLNKRIAKNSYVAYACYIIGFLSLISGVWFTVIGIASLDELQNLLSKYDKQMWGIYTLVILKSMIILGLLIASSKYSFTLGKSFMQEALKNADRRHAISFGEFFIKAYGDKIDSVNDIKEIFADWNIDKSSSFSSLETSSFDPKIMESLLEVIKNLSNKEK